MGSFRELTLITKGLQSEVKVASDQILATLESDGLSNPRFSFTPIASGEFFDEYTSEISNLKDKYTDVFSKFSTSIGGTLIILESSDEENTNFAVFNKGRLLARLSNFPNSEYNSDFFYKQENIIDDELFQMQPFNSLTSDQLKDIFAMEMDQPYIKLSGLLHIDG